MKVIKQIEELKDFVAQRKKDEQRIGYVPTMGYLHEGHLKLMQECQKVANTTIVSIFVNPAQFNDIKDYEKYPRNTERDLKLCEDLNIDAVFLPEVEEIYPEGPISTLKMRIPHLMDKLCGLYRPGHFEGVITVLGRLFHIVQPDVALFGKKDYQQYLIVKEFVKELMFPIQILGVDTVREATGLAKSSRNARLNEQELETATLIYRALKIGEEYCKKKETSIEELIEVMKEVLLTSPLIRVEYISILNPNDLTELIELKGEIFIGIA
ncbi:MAG: pantoate--beta-alanine ligase, partial [Leptospiraceae bacterium]|nr:pantoate--beta-alanine ligase [Leptospiraceae bacterium]